MSKRTGTRTADPELSFLDRLAAVHAELHDLESIAPPGRRAGLADALELIEAELASLGYRLPEACCAEGELTEADHQFFAELGDPAELARRELIAELTRLGVDDIELMLHAAAETYGPGSR